MQHPVHHSISPVMKHLIHTHNLDSLTSTTNYFIRYHFKRPVYQRSHIGPRSLFWHHQPQWGQLRTYWLQSGYAPLARTRCCQRADCIHGNLHLVTTGKKTIEDALTWALINVRTSTLCWCGRAGRCSGLIESNRLEGNEAYTGSGQLIFKLFLMNISVCLEMVSCIKTIYKNNHWKKFKQKDILGVQKVTR